MINNVVLLGRLTADPELKVTTSGKDVCPFTIAVDRSFVKPGEERQADFINIVAWGQTAIFVNRYFRKGSMIALTGSIQTQAQQEKILRQNSLPLPPHINCLMIMKKSQTMKIYRSD